MGRGWADLVSFNGALQTLCDIRVANPAVASADEKDDGENPCPFKV